MNNFNIGRTTLLRPNSVDIIVSKVLCDDGTYLDCGEVSFAELEKWITSIKGERITVATDAYCHECRVLDRP